MIEHAFPLTAFVGLSADVTKVTTNDYGTGHCSEDVLKATVTYW